MSAYDHPPEWYDHPPEDEPDDPFEEEAMLAREEQRQHDRDLERDTLDRIPEAP